MMNSITIAAVDPGTVNIAAWVGTFEQQAGKVHTINMMHGVPLDVENKDNTTQSDTKPKSKAKPKKKAVYALTADCAEYVADICQKNDVKNIVVETAPQWNIAARISAAAAYGVFRGRKLPVGFSGPTTKTKAMMAFAEQMGITDQLEKIPEEWDRMDKKTSAKVRLINKRNSQRVVEALLNFSNDAEGIKAFHASEKKDDMADAVLLACGGVMTVSKQKAICKKITVNRGSKHKKACDTQPKPLLHHKKCVAMP
jgi:hypothetical protein